MGFFQPSPPPFDLEEWRAKPYLERLKAVAQDWAVNGFGTPDARLPALRGQARRLRVGAVPGDLATTPGLGGLGDIDDWWTEPIVFQKLAVWTLLWEILGLGSGSMPLASRFVPADRRLPLLAAPRHRAPAAVAGQGPAHARHAPHRRSTSRSTPASSPPRVYLLLDGGEPVAGLAGGRLDPTAIVVLLGLLGLLGLRDKVPFLAARPEIYGFLLLVSLFPLENLIVGWQLVFVCIWWGAASSKLNHHFPYVIAVMVSTRPGTARGR